MKNILYFLCLSFLLVACSKENKKEETTSINYDEINTCGILDYNQLASILEINLTEFSEDLSHVQISSAGSKSCTFSFNKTSDPTQFHSILIYISPKIAGSNSFENVLASLENQGRNINGNTVLPTQVNSSANTTLRWEYSYPFETLEYQTQLQEEILLSVSYFHSSNLNAVANADSKLFEIFTAVQEDILSE